MCQSLLESMFEDKVCKWSRKQDWVGRAVGCDTDTTKASAEFWPQFFPTEAWGPVLCTPITLRLWIQAAPQEGGTNFGKTTLFSLGQFLKKESPVSH